MPTTQADHEKDRAYIAQVRELRRAAARRRRWVAGGLLAAVVVVLVLAFVLHFSPLYALIPAALCVVVCALGANAAKQARAWEAKMAAKERERRRKAALAAKRAQQRARQRETQPTAVDAPREEEARTDVLEQREIRRALHQGRIEQQEALARRQRTQQEMSADVAAQTVPADDAPAEDPRAHAQLVVREQDNAYLLDETNELSRVAPASAVDAFDMAVNQDLISFSLGSPRNGVEIEEDEPQSLEIKSMRQVAKAVPPEEPVEPQTEAEPQADVADAAPAGPAAVNDSVAFHESETAAAVEAPDETSDSLGASLETILARRNG